MQQKGIIAISIVLGFGFLSVMVVVTRFLWSHHKAPKDSEAAANEHPIDRTTQRNSIFFLQNSWSRIFPPKQQKNKGLLLPSLAGIIKAGEEAVYSPALFDRFHGHPGDVLLETLLDTFANELRARPMTERATYSPEISRLISTTGHRITRSLSLKVTKSVQPDTRPKTPRHSIDLAERGLGRSRSKRTADALVALPGSLPSTPVGSTVATSSLWTKDLQDAQRLDGKAGVTITAGELVVLSLVLGSPITLSKSAGQSGKRETALSDRKGAFGISIHAKQHGNGKSRVVFRQHKRSIPHLPARGSRYSILSAKHLAFGSLPFSQDTNTVHTILISNETLNALQSGTCLHIRQTSAADTASEYLSSLPGSRQLNFHTLIPSITKSSSTPLLLHTIANMPFTGGLTPLASTALAKAVQFVASGGLPPARLLQRLEALVEKVHRQAPSLQLFGSLLDDCNAGLLFRERERLGKVATGAAVEDTISDKSARMHRYTTLLERLMYLVPDMKPDDVLCAVRKATKKEFERSYQDAVAVYTSMPTTPASPICPSPSHRSRRSLRSNSPSTSPDHPSHTPIPASPTTLSSPRPSSTFPPQNLGKQVEQVLKGSLPFDIETIALVARLVLVAWTLSVKHVVWEGEDVPSKDGTKMPGLEAFKDLGAMVLL